MKNTLLFFILISLEPLAQQQVPALQWSQKVVCTGTGSLLDITTDENGNVYCIGKCSDTIDFTPWLGTNQYTRYAGYSSYTAGSPLNIKIDTGTDNSGNYITIEILDNN